MSSASELLIAEYRGQLNEQLAEVESARTRAAVALSVSGVVAGLFGPHLLSDPNNYGRSVVGVFALTAIAAVYVLLPHRLTLWSDGDAWLQWTIEYDEWLQKARATGAHDEGGPQLALRMAKDFEVWRNRNTPRLKRIQYCLAATFLGVCCQLILWVLAVLIK